MPNGQWYPPEWPERIRALAAGEITAATPRRAATVMLLRDDAGGSDGAAPLSAGPAPASAPYSGDGLAVHMLRRRASMAFAAGAYAYPGGGVDPRDNDRLVGWAGPGRDVWARRLGVDAASAQAIVCAAVRETYEEAGVLLAGETAGTVVDDTTGDGWEADRAALVDRELSFADFLDRRGLVLRSDLLGAWARWITPEFEPRRYDTWFFVAALPHGPADQERLDGGRPYGVDQAGRGDGGVRQGRAADDAADRLDAAGAPVVRYGRRGARRCRRTRSDACAGHGQAGGRGTGAELAGARRVHQAAGCHRT